MPEFRTLIARNRSVGCQVTRSRAVVPVARRYAMVAADCQHCEWSIPSNVFNILVRSGARPL